MRRWFAKHLAGQPEASEVAWMAAERFLVDSDAEPRWEASVTDYSAVVKGYQAPVVKAVVGLENLGRGWGLGPVVEDLQGTSSFEPDSILS